MATKHNAPEFMRRLDRAKKASAREWMRRLVSLGATQEQLDRAFASLMRMGWMTKSQRNYRRRLFRQEKRQAMSKVIASGNMPV